MSDGEHIIITTPSLPSLCVQVIMDEYSLCYSGDHIPALKPHPLPVQGEEGEESDAEILQRDIIEVSITRLNTRVPFFMVFVARAT